MLEPSFKHFVQVCELVHKYQSDNLDSDTFLENHNGDGFAMLNIVLAPTQNGAALGLPRVLQVLLSFCHIMAPAQRFTL